MNIKPLSEALINKGTKVLVRSDLDVPIKKGVIEETFRLDSSLPTLKYIIEKGGFPIIAGHIGRPDDVFLPELSTKQLLPYFNENLGEGNFELLENLRFDPREEENDEEFAKELASRGQIYVNDSFATCHRNHASITGITKFLPSFAGIALQREISNLKKVTENPERPLSVIIGGSKLESKLPVIEKFQETADYIMLSSLLSANWSKEITQNLILSYNRDTSSKDINEKTRQKFIEIIEKSKTILWAGPLGMYEEEKYISGTKVIAEKIAELTQNKKLYSIIGGGDTVAAINKLGLLNKFSFVSGGGSAMLEFLTKGTLPGIEALEQCQKY